MMYDMYGERRLATDIFANVTSTKDNAVIPLGRLSQHVTLPETLRVVVMSRIRENPTYQRIVEPTSKPPWHAQ